MGVGAGLYVYVVVVQKFTFAISSPDEFLWLIQRTYRRHFYTIWKGNPSIFLMPKISAKFQRVTPNGGAK